MSRLRPSALVAIGPYLVAGMMVGLALLAAVTAVAGWRVFGVVSASMAPTLERGDAVVTTPVRPVDVRAGDLITFPDPGGRVGLVTHRVLYVAAEAGRVAFETRGDAATTSEHWTMPADGTLRRVSHRLPGVGHALVAAASPGGRLLLLGVPAVGLAAIALTPARRLGGEVGAEARP